MILRSSVGWMGFLALVFLFSCGVGQVRAEEPFKLSVLGREEEPRVPPVWLQGTLYLWVRDLVEPLGMTVNFHEEPSRTAEVCYGEKKLLSLEAGQAVAMTPDGEINLGFAPYYDIIGRLIVPAREVAEALGAFTWWSEESKTLYICSLVKRAQVTLEEGEVLLRVQGSLPVAYEAHTLAEPDRIYLDLFGACLRINPPEFTVGRWDISRVRLAQFSREPFTVRVVLDLPQAQDYALISPEVTEEIVVRIGERRQEEELPPLPKLEEIVFSQLSEEELEARISFDAPIAHYQTLLLNSPARVALDIPEALLALEGRLIESNKPILPRIRFSQFSLSPYVVRVVFDLDTFLPFNVTKSADGKLLLVHFSTASGRGSVVIDPGHGGEDPGAIGNLGTFEKKMNLDIALRLQKLLQKLGIKCFLTRSDDVSLPLDQRAEMANKLKADIFVSIHCNAWISPNGRKGLETYYFHEHSRELAETIHQKLVAGLRLRDNGVRTARFVVVNKTEMPAILVEIGYINHDDDEQLLRQPEFRQKAAQALLAGILSYLMAREPSPKMEKVSEVVEGAD